VVKVQGRRGEVAAELHTDFPERFAERRRLYALAQDGQRRELHLEEFWPHLGRMVFKFQGIDSISQAEALVGCDLQVPRSERAPLEEGAVYVEDLIGCTVWDDAGGSLRRVGEIAEVQFGGGEAPLLIVREAGREHIIPFAAEYVVAANPGEKRLHMRLPGGMLELDAPLTEEEKRAQHRPRRHES
jgi:16S rRNA processing protein RimM